MRSIAGWLGLASAVLGTLVGGVIAAPRDAEAFCGFYVAPGDEPVYNDASMVALMRAGSRTVMSMSNNYRGPAADFAMVVPVPVVLKKSDVKTLPLDVFQKLEKLSAPRLVEYWEQDPCAKGKVAGDGAMGAGAVPEAAAPAEADASEYGVKIEAQFKVGEYKIVILSAEQSDGLERWLVDNNYKIPKGASAALAPYIKEQQKFFVAKVDIKKVEMDSHGVATLSPLRFAYESHDFRLPVRLGLLNAMAKQDLLIFVLARGKRYQAANYPNAFIPTNLDVAPEARNSFSPFYARLFDATVGKAGGRAIVTEYAWDSSSCDPCPIPPLEDVDIATLGGDILDRRGTGDDSDESGMVLTRLHTRYDASTLTEDIVFRAAEAVAGGREFIDEASGSGTLEKGARFDATNNFQARYAIRHVWTGQINCEQPQRSIWGGPPAGGKGAPDPIPATNLASAPRGKVKLASLIRRGLDDADSWDRAASEIEQSDLAGVPRSHACGCSIRGGDATWGVAGGLAIAALAITSVRRSRRPRRDRPR